jgi:hypothetical protein
VHGYHDFYPCCRINRQLTFHAKNGISCIATIRSASRNRCTSLSARAREALKLVASNPHGATEAFMYAHGFSLRMLIGVVRRRVATVQKERVNAGAKPVKVIRIRITDAGLRALKD